MNRLLHPILSCSLLLLICFTVKGQEQKRLLDSLNSASEPERGVFRLYITPPSVELLVGGYRNRDYALQGFKPMAYSYFFCLPFQYDLSYVHLKAREKLIKLNTVVVIHHTNHFNYALGMGERISFLLFKHTYASYQGGVVWCEVVNRQVNDGIQSMGFSFHHVFALTYSIKKKISVSATVSHISGGNLFKKMTNNQDVIGIGLSYKF